MIGTCINCKHCEKRHKVKGLNPQISEGDNICMVLGYVIPNALRDNLCSDAYYDEKEQKLTIKEINKWKQNYTRMYDEFYVSYYEDGEWHPVNKQRGNNLYKLFSFAVSTAKKAMEKHELVRIQAYNPQTDSMDTLYNW